MLLVRLLSQQVLVSDDVMFDIGSAFAAHTRLDLFIDLFFGEKNVSLQNYFLSRYGIGLLSCQKQLFTIMPSEVACHPELRHLYL